MVATTTTRGGAWFSERHAEEEDEEEEEEEEKEEEKEKKDIFARVVSIFAQKFLTSNTSKKKKRKKKERLLLLGFRVYLEKEKKGDSATLSSKNKKNSTDFVRAHYTHRHINTTIFNKTRTQWHRFAYVRCFRSRRERRDGRAVRVVFLSLLFSRFLSDDSRHRDSDGRSRPRVRCAGGRGARSTNATKKGEDRGIETNRYRTTRFCASEARSTVASFRSGTRFQDLSRAKS